MLKRARIICIIAVLVALICAIVISSTQKNKDKHYARAVMVSANIDPLGELYEKKYDQ